MKFSLFILSVFALYSFPSFSYSPPQSIGLTCERDYEEVDEVYSCEKSNHSTSSGDFRVSLRLGADGANALYGSGPTNNEAALDLYVALPVSLNLFGLSNLKIIPSYESFERIGYKRAALELGKEFRYKRLSYTIGAEAGIIEREGHGRYANYGVNNSFEYEFNKTISGGILVQTQNRTDLNQIYGKVNGLPQVRLSNFVYLKIKLK